MTVRRPRYVLVPRGVKNKLARSRPNPSSNYVPVVGGVVALAAGGIAYLALKGGGLGSLFTPTPSLTLNGGTSTVSTGTSGSVVVSVTGGTPNGPATTVFPPTSVPTPSSPGCSNWATTLTTSSPRPTDCPPTNFDGQGNLNGTIEFTETAGAFFVSVYDATTHKYSNTVPVILSDNGGGGGSDGGCTGTCSCPDGESCQSDCGTCGDGNWSCNDGVCYIPTASAISPVALSVNLVTGAQYTSTCCQYALYAKPTANCQFIPSSAVSSAAVVVVDGHNNPMSGVAVTITLVPNNYGNGLLSLGSGTSYGTGTVVKTLTDINGLAYCSVFLSGPPPPYNVPSAYPSCVEVNDAVVCGGSDAYGQVIGTQQVGQLNFTVKDLPGTIPVLLSAVVYGDCIYDETGGCPCL
jgi:hypothetical protein